MDSAYNMWGLILSRVVQIVLIAFLSLFLWTCGPNAVSCLKGSRSSIFGFCSAPVKTNEKQEKQKRRASEQFLEWRLEIHCRFIDVLLPMLSFFMVVFIVGLLEVTDLHLVMTRVIPVVLLYALCVLFYRGTIPRSSKVIDVLGVILILMYALRLYSDLDVFKTNFFQRLLPTVRALASVTFLNFWKVAVANIIVSAVNIVFHGLVIGVYDADWFLEMVSEVLVLGFILILAHIVEAGARLLVTQRLEAKTSTEGRRAVGSILSVLCDAVVHLGCDLTILNECRQLGHLLMSGMGSCHKLEGGHFLRHVVDEDKPRFDNFIKQQAELARAPVDTDSAGLMGDSAASAAVPAALHVSLKDAMGTVFRVEVIHAHLSNFDQDGHLLGIRDLGDNMRAECLNESPIQFRSDHLFTHEEHLAMSSRSSDSSESLGQGELQNGLHSGKLQSLNVLVDALREQMPILSASLQCQSFDDEGEAVSEQELPNLKAWLKSKGSRHFLAWAQDANNALHYGDPVIPYGGVKLRPFGSWLQMTSRSVSACTDEETGMMRLTFDDVNVCFPEMPGTHKRPLPCIRETSGASRSSTTVNDTARSPDIAHSQSHTGQVIGSQTRVTL
eukprot:TRINITY_DN9240_c1_g3_i1.p1 TRINITY_DN9240_c1_g3~~TRINITY_DN9240_c1_g3_i1.p1  ORF type:complete len:613 (-),score=46.77 TRINITY_DN9240_c1_g3_i1:250-2088(-)